jgi:hypothetical protein
MTSPLDWYREFVAAVVSRLPGDIDEASARRWIDDPDGLAQVLEGLVSPGATAGGATAGTLQNDKAKDGWQLVVDAVEPAAISGEAIELASLQEEGEEEVFGDEVVDRVRRLDGLLGQRHVEYLLQHPREIPDDFQRYSLVFAGTIWLSPDGNHQVPCASWRQGSWELTFGILEGGLDSRDRLVRPRG